MTLPLWKPPENRRLNVVCLGAHPDDPESCCGGTLFELARKGHAVTAVYLTRGERGIAGATDDQAAATRTAEALAACDRLGITGCFAGLIDSEVATDRRSLEAVHQIVAPLAPDLLLAHWPIDTHHDHQAASVLAQRVAARLGRTCTLWFFPAMEGTQSRGYTPTHAIDIGSEACRLAKTEALALHRSQDGARIYTAHHGPMDARFGCLAGVTLAETFAAP